MDLGHLRENYETAGLHESDLAPGPIDQFQKWFLDAQHAELYEPNAMVVVTVDDEGWPSARNLLLKAFDERGFVFYTNYHSAKARDLERNPRCALTFSWLGLNRQVRIRGTASLLSSEDSDTYFSARPRGSQVGAWASPQSEVIADRSVLENAWAENEERFADTTVTRPPHWGGIRVEPLELEFWQGRRNRLHDRLRYRRIDNTADSGGTEPQWVVERLAP